MKKVLPAVLLFALVLSLVVSAGCGDKTTVKTPDGSATVEEQDGDVTINYDEGGGSGSVTASTEAPTEAELGAPIYPGAEYDESGSGTLSYNGQDGSGTTAAGTFLTNDSLGKVVDWYTAELGQPLVSTPDLVQWMSGEVTSGQFTSVQVEDSGGTRKITIVRSTIKN
ncbi:MAG: hypothetical protein A2V52_01750 [Actinobacteria bacterium RBG_19FT_COMBO_54_7]|uniref:Uncharacterized protein n=1 Tax=Candidatus Solincola sediminis TaxID=1797199 RepID=A0A1F2WSL2_9ACTN|nr:MAG: hypothetical protein A2W01_06160 [Candidatus Solincola sediminis]OFW59795.1 MAG: hypothetical protein A2Y75_07955 [Candidatus Solincola sediminis]OFW67811.1 MAG: hypothetical protein A2V52_01750 [Actinobacteria bacterium RBG_19FT_COMBO_54_7]